MTRRGRCTAGSALVAVSLWLGLACAARSQAPEMPPDPLRERVEKLEKRNEDLSKALREQQEKVRQLEEKTRPPEAPRELVVGKDLKFNASWVDGLQLETADRAFRVTVGGRGDFDSAWYAAPRDLSRSIGLFNNFADPNTGLSDGAEFRRARLRIQGTAWEVMQFSGEYEFANALDLRRRTLGVSPVSGPTVYDFDPAPGTRFTDVWLGFTKLPYLGTFRAGHQREWVTFANATGGRFLTFLERPLLFDAFNNDFQYGTGFTLQRTFLDDRAYAWVGLFRVNSRLGAFDVGDGEYAYDARLTFLPVWDEKRRQWAHIGVDYSYRNLNRNQTRFRGRPLVFAGTIFQVPHIVDTGPIFSRDAQQFANLEFASAWGPLTLTGEFAFTWVTDAHTGGLPQPGGRLPADVVRRGTYLAHGAYVEALYFLTGEHRGYRREQPGYDRIRPHEPFFVVSGEGDRLLWGRGAWEIGLRYDFLDLTDDGINGGVAQAVTVGLNWHLNPNMKVQWNYVWMERSFDPSDAAGRRPGSLHGLGMRFHWDF